MNTLYDQFQRCIRHPHQRIVGVCSSCLQERLISLVEPPSPPAEIRRGYVGDEHARGLSISSQPNVAFKNEHAVHKSICVANTNLHKTMVDAVTEIVPRSHGDAHTQEKATVCMHPGSTSTMATESHDDLPTLPMHTGRHGHHPSCDFAGRTSCVDQNGHIVKKDKDGFASLPVSLDKRNRGTDAQDWQNRASFREGEKKKGGSWFLLSKSRSSSHTTHAQADDRSNYSRHALKSPQQSVASTGRSSDACRNVHNPDLEAVAGISMKDSSSKIQSHISRETGTSTSWISVFFNRKRSSRSRSNLSNSSNSSIQNAFSSANGTNINASEPNNHQKPLEAGRLSWDGARPNFKQLLKKIEARGKLQSQTDLSSPLQYVDYAMFEHNANNRDAINQEAFLQKSKSVAYARSSISVEIPKDVMQSSFSPTLHQGQSNVMVGLEYDKFDDDRDFQRSRSWGRTWNRALSPLWGSRSHRHKVTINGSSSAHQRDYRHVCTPVTPNHVNLRNAATPASSSRLSPLRRTKLAPTLKNQKRANLHLLLLYLCILCVS